MGERSKVLKKSKLASSEEKPNSPLIPIIIPQTVYPGEQLHLVYNKDVLDGFRELRFHLQGYEIIGAKSSGISYGEAWVWTPEREELPPLSPRVPSSLPTSTSTQSMSSLATPSSPHLSSSVSFPPSAFFAHSAPVVVFPKTCSDNCPHVNSKPDDTVCFQLAITPTLPPTCFLPDASIAYLLKIEGELIKSKLDAYHMPIICVTHRMERLSGRASGMTRSTIERTPTSCNMHIECNVDKTSYCFGETITAWVQMKNTTDSPITEIMLSIVERVTLEKISEKRKHIIEEFPFKDELPALPGAVYRQPFTVKIPDPHPELPPSVRANGFRVEYHLEVTVKFGNDSKLNSPVARTLLLLVLGEGPFSPLSERMMTTLTQATLATCISRKKGLWSSLKNLLHSAD